MSILHINQAIEEDFSKPLSDIAWFHDYLDRKFKTVFEDDLIVVVGNGLFGHIDNIALIRVIIKCVVRACSNKISCMLSIEQSGMYNVDFKLLPDNCYDNSFLPYLFFYPYATKFGVYLGAEEIGRSRMARRPQPEYCKHRHGRLLMSLVTVLASYCIF